MKVRRWLLRVLLVLSLVPVVALGIGCKPVCAATLRAEDSALGKWLDRVEKNNRQEEAGEKKPGPWKPEGGPVRGGGVAPKATCKGGGGAPVNKPMFGAKGPQRISSEPVYNGSVNKIKYHIDIENPAPGKREASMHVQISEPAAKWRGRKFEYDPETGKFRADKKTGEELPGTVRRDIEDNAGDAIKRGLRKLGEE